MKHTKKVIKAYIRHINGLIRIGVKADDAISNTKQSSTDGAEVWEPIERHYEGLD